MHTLLRIAAIVRARHLTSKVALCPPASTVPLVFPNGSRKKSGAHAIEYDRYSSTGANPFVERRSLHVNLDNYALNWPKEAGKKGFTRYCV